MGVPDEAHNHERDAVGSRFNEVGARYRKETLVNSVTGFATALIQLANRFL
jgi:hypothetical protein